MVDSIESNHTIFYTLEHLSDTQRHQHTGPRHWASRVCLGVLEDGQRGRVHGAVEVVTVGVVIGGFHLVWRKDHKGFTIRRFSKLKRLDLGMDAIFGNFPEADAALVGADGEDDMGSDATYPDLEAVPVADWFDYEFRLAEPDRTSYQYFDASGLVYYPCADCFYHNWASEGDPDQEAELAARTPVRLRSAYGGKELVPCDNCVSRAERDAWRRQTYGTCTPSLEFRIYHHLGHPGPIDYIVDYPDNRPAGIGEERVQMLANCYRCGTAGPAEQRCFSCRPQSYRVLFCTDSGRVICPMLLNSFLERTPVANQPFAKRQNQRKLRRFYLTDLVVERVFFVRLSYGMKQLLNELVHDHDRVKARGYCRPFYGHVGIK